MNTETFITLTRLGQLYGVNARDVGSWLKGLGFRQDDGRPSREAVEHGFVQERALEYGGSPWHWHREKTCAVLDGMCYKRAEQRLGEQHDGFVLIRGG